MPKNVKKFLLCSASAERRRRAGLPPAGRQLKACPVGNLFSFGVAVRIFVKKSSNFNQKVPPIFKIRILGDCCLAPPKAGRGFGKDFEGIFEIQKQFLPAQTEVRRAKHRQNEVLQTNLFCSARGGTQSDNFKYFDCLIKTI